MNPQACKLISSKTELELKDFDALVIPIQITQAKDKSWAQQLKHLPAALSEAIVAFAKKAEIVPQEGTSFIFDYSITLRVGLVYSFQTTDMFHLLTFAKEILGKYKSAGVQNVALDLRQHPRAEDLLEAFVAALVARNFEPPKISGKKNEVETGKKDKFWNMAIVAPAAKEDECAERLQRAEPLAQATNLVRSLVMRPGNDLTPAAYVQMVKELAEKTALKFEFWDQKKLKTLNAGAFLAVVQGSPHEDAGIIKLVYRPENSHAKKLVVVGKGITYDTGGTNLKPARSMYGMHGDMAGSAVALSLTLLAAENRWPFQVVCYLAIADNCIGENAYRPNDIVMSAKAKSIEVVHTDAEGRMVLADTLFFASKEKADLMMDFATLTGACVGAIGSTYAGAFTNRPEWFEKIVKTGQVTGERVWPFPLDEDFGDCLKSDVADIKQCRLSGGVDHIEAAYFLKEFVDQDIPWLHIDLAAAQNAGGLAHIDTEATGFGVRFAANFAQSILEDGMD